jgi:arylsulfatase A-like enzyme
VRIRDALVQPVDLLPTVLEWAGITVPAGTQGHSLRPCLHGQAARLRDLAFSGSSLPWPNQRPISVTDGQWMFLDTGDAQSWELYDIRVDPEQQQDLARVRPDRAAQMHRAVLDYLRERGTPEVHPLSLLLDIIEIGSTRRDRIEKSGFTVTLKGAYRELPKIEP